MLIKQAVPDDAPELAQLIGLIWHDASHDDTPNAASVARVIQERGECTLIGCDENRVLGFVDAFMTMDMGGAPRWEVDLLGVHPDARGKGTAVELIRSACEYGADQGADYARAVVRHDNVGAQKTFSHAGFKTDGKSYRLCIASPPEIEDSLIDMSSEDGAYLIPVTTLTYRGVWIEGTPTPRGLVAARVICMRHGWDTAGVLLADETTPDGYEEVGVYQFWTKSLS